MILWQQTNTKLNRADLLSLSIHIVVQSFVMCSLQPICWETLRQIDYCSIQLYQLNRICFLSLPQWCSWHIHHQIRCCVVLLSGTIWRYGCEKAVRFIKHNNIFRHYHLCILLTLSPCHGWVDCCVCCYLYRQSFVSLNCLCPESALSFLSRQHHHIWSRDGLRDLSWHVLIANSDYWWQSVRLTH